MLLASRSTVLSIAFAVSTSRTRCMPPCRSSPRWMRFFMKTFFTEAGISGMTDGSRK
jgi:hypothetical protein